MNLGKKIKLIRNIKGMSQGDLAEKIGRTRALVTHIESTGKVHAETLKLILKALAVTPEDFDNYKTEKDFLKPKRELLETETEKRVLEERLVSYQKENSYLKDMVETQKAMIQLLTKKKK